MAYLNCKYDSAILGKETEVNIFLPDKLGADMPVVWLLHGMNGSQESWRHRAETAKLLNELNMIGIMPYAANSFYCNMKTTGERYEDVITQELPEYLSKFLPISRKREKNYIMGLSMGGYGAFKLALNHPELYTAAVSLSGCIDIILDFEDPEWELGYGKDIWGDDYKTAAKNTGDDLLYLLENYPADAPRPKLYFCCGTEDFLYPQNMTFLECIKNKDFDWHYEKGTGVHDWNFFEPWSVKGLSFVACGNK